jgi:hypothetical protein
MTDVPVSHAFHVEALAGLPDDDQPDGRGREQPRPSGHDDVDRQDDTRPD